MAKLLSTLGFFGFVLLATAYLNAPSAGPVQANEDHPQSNCHMAEVALDEGYGISRTEIRSVCE